MGTHSMSIIEEDTSPQARVVSGLNSVCMEEDDKRSQWVATRGTYSEYLEYKRRFQTGSAMRRILLVMVLLAALAALVVGVVKLLVWLVYLCTAIHVRIWLADLWDSATVWVIQAWNSMQMLVLLVVGISLALLILLYCGLWMFGFMAYGISLGSYAAMWMSSIGVVAAGSLFSLLQMIAMGGISVLTVLLYIVPCVALVVGAFEIIVWVAHSGAIHVPTWLVDSWESSTAWVLHVWDSVEIFGWWYNFVAWLHNIWDSATGWLLHAWDSIEIFGWWYNFVAWLHNLWDSATGWVFHAWDSIEIFGWWYSFVAWLHNMWESIIDHHKWKIYT